MPRLACLIVFVLICSLSFACGQNDIEIEAYYCSFKLPDIYKQNSSFSILVHFELDDEGRPININTYVPLSSDENKEIVSREEVSMCMKKWKIKGFPKKTIFIAVWSWKHGDGWGPLKIIGPRFKQTIYAQAQ